MEEANGGSTLCPTHRVGTGPQSQPPGPPSPHKTHNHTPHTQPHTTHTTTHHTQPHTPHSPPASHPQAQSIAYIAKGNRCAGYVAGNTATGGRGGEGMMTHSGRGGSGWSARTTSSPRWASHMVHPVSPGGRPSLLQNTPVKSHVKSERVHPAVDSVTGGSYQQVGRTNGWAVPTGGPYQPGDRTNRWTVPTGGAVPTGGPYQRVDRTNGWTIPTGGPYQRVGRTNGWTIPTGGPYQQVDCTNRWTVPTGGMGVI
ncbi:hypothetical protein NHX12_014854 [Muraenolepis orangiensis]|uniref:Uncharacterized protein n=1 Tax=Muraenolepis orangiensis TaxID=630683 RepID=A0A9Q0D8U6_9TELE|nr:hypothetical protein NHX12_014854 [Muraenolepis orangiensis]